MKPIAPVVYAFLAVMLLLDGVMGAMIWRQSVVASWPTVEGVVTSTSSERDVMRSRFMSCPAIEFRYDVDGTTYEGDRYRAGRFCSSSPYDVDSILRQYPAGEPATVYVNPDDASEAYLEAGLGRVEYLGLLVLLPFNAFALGWVLEIAARLVGRSLTPGVKYREDAAVLPRIPALSFMLGTMLVAGFVLAIVAVFGFEYLSVPALETTWLALGVLAATAFVGKLAWNVLRPRRLVARAEGWTLPGGEQVPPEAIAGVGVRAGDQKPPHPTYHTVVLLVDSDTERRKLELAEFPSEEEAERLAGWIEERSSTP